MLSSARYGLGDREHCFAHARPSFVRALLLLAQLATVASGARAAGLGVPDLGATSLSQGAATVAAPEDLLALYYNPSALVLHPGLRLLVDGRAVNHRVSFQRLAADGSNPEDFSRVDNQGPWKLSPLVVASYGFALGGLPLSLSAGGYPATGYSGYDFPDPVELRGSLGTCATCNAENARRAPQRYSLISSGSSSYTLALAAAVQPTRWLALGASLQNTMVHLKTRQAIGANPFAAGEFTGYDAILTVDATDDFTLTGALGATARFGDLAVGASFQLPYDVNAHGTLGIEVPQVLAAVGATVTGDQTDVGLHLPWIARVGVRFIQASWELELALTWDAWSRYQEVTFKPRGVAFQIPNRDPVSVPDIHLAKGMQDAQSVRLGGLVHLGERVPALSFLTLRVGLLGETSAVPEQYTSIDQAHWERISLGVGATATFGRFDVTLGYAHFIQPDRQVRDSAVVQPAPLRPAADASVVGNGDFSASEELLGLSLAAHFEP